MFGGIHTTLNTQQVMQENPWLDFANVGEGDDSLIDLVNALQSGGKTTGIGNLWARNGDVIRNPSRRLKDISVLPWMDLDNWEFKRITENRRGPQVPWTLAFAFARLGNTDVTSFRGRFQTGRFVAGTELQRRSAALGMA